MNEVRLNLARKWRSKDFDTIIGQELSVRMLKNSLYLGQYFPVYLLSGQRGCGKTTTARVFAAAINCEKLTAFQQSPKQQIIPCGQCLSCRSMLEGKHPDFIEIDAASHTGVDNVRQIIEASSLLPLMGRKKIYLVDEAHMLSKAAFNAFLKILEEPPKSVLFMLATTDPQKIIETVRSRCFQLFFTAVTPVELKKHLKTVCDNENIPYEENAFDVIIQQSEGSVRDALNLLEQVRFSAPSITQDAVLKSLGQLSNKQLLQLFECVLHKGGSPLLSFISELKLESYSAEKIYESFIEIVRVSLWIKHGVKPVTLFDVAELQAVTASVSLERLNGIFELLTEHEAIIAKTTKKHLMLEMLLLKLCQPTTIKKETNQNSHNAQKPEPIKQQVAPTTQKDQHVAQHTTQTTSLQLSEVQDASWASFLSQLESINDPFIKSIFIQSRYESFDVQSGILTICFAEQFAFFNDLIVENSSVWLPLLKSVFGEKVSLKTLFKGEAPQLTVTKAEQSKEAAHDTRPEKEEQPKDGSRNGFRTVQKAARPSFEKKGKSIDVSDTQTWQKTALVLKYFPGNVAEIAES